jgi:hypothetical protein
MLPWTRRSLILMTLAVCTAFLLGSSAVALASAPTITGISPNNGTFAGGTSVTLTGTGFVAGSTVKFGATSATGVVIHGLTSITATSPAGTEIVGISVTNSNGTTAATPYDRFAYDPAPSPLWLGLDGNSSEIGAEHIGEFTTHNVVYDRGGGGEGIEFTAGEILEEGGHLTVRGTAIARSIEAGMTPDIVIEFAGYEGNFEEDPADFPTEANHKLIPYIEGFIKTAKAVREKYPGKQVDFEPINEPAGYTTPQHNGAEYANVIAKLLPEARAAGIPLNSIFVSAQGKNCSNPENKFECTNNGWVPAMYTADPALREEIAGWYLHPYGLPSEIKENDNGGIQAVPMVQEKMTSGQNNIIVSEVGFCALDVYIGVSCFGGPEVATSTLAAQDLTETLDHAKSYHEAGWLRALIVYDRKGNGWSMQNPSWTLTKQGEALDAFADLFGSVWSVQSTAGPSGLAKNRLTAVSCSSSTACIGTGWQINTANTYVPLVESWNGTEWSTQSAPAPSGATVSTLEAVSCTSSTACTAAGHYVNSSGTTVTLAERWNGTEWIVQTTPNPTSATSSVLWGVSCASSTSCTATGEYVNSSGTTVSLAEGWNGTEWAIQTTPNPTGATSTSLPSVSCTSSTACTAAGYINNAGAWEPIAERWNGTSWSIQTTPKPSGAGATFLQSVSCTSSTTCNAVGYYVNSSATYVSLAERWNGTSWSTQTTPNPTGATGSYLQGISCSSSTLCTTTGEYVNSSGTKATLAERWNGTEWAIQITPNPTGATESVFRWTSCPSSTSCTALGWYINNKGITTNQAEIY